MMTSKQPDGYESHPSWGMVQFSRVEHGGPCRLFGSSLSNHGTWKESSGFKFSPLRTAAPTELSRSRIEVAELVERCAMLEQINARLQANTKRLRAWLRWMLRQYGPRGDMKSAFCTKDCLAALHGKPPPPSKRRYAR